MQACFLIRELSVDFAQTVHFQYKVQYSKKNHCQNRESGFLINFSDIYVWCFFLMTECGNAALCLEISYQCILRHKFNSLLQIFFFLRMISFQF